MSKKIKISEDQLQRLMLNERRRHTYTATETNEEEAPMDEITASEEETPMEEEEAPMEEIETNEMNESVRKIKEQFKRFL